MIECILSKGQKFTTKDELLITFIVGTEKDSYILVKVNKVVGWICNRKTDLELKSKLENHRYNMYMIDKKKLGGEVSD